METFKIILLTVAVCVQLTSQESTGDSSTQIPKPNITRNPTHKVLYSTETVTLHCEVPGGASEFQYDWYKDSTNLETDHQSNVTVKEGGKYECKAKNGTSESENSDAYTLTLQAIPTPTLSKPMWTDVYTTENVSLKCEIQGSTENWTYRWFKNMVQESKSHLDILSAKKDDSGNYTCKGFLQGRVETTMSNSVTIKVQAIPTPTLTKPMRTDVYTTENVSLKCEIQGSTENWTYRWFKKKDEVQESKSQLDIQSAKKDDSGNYTCKGFLQGRVETTMSNSVTIKVQDLPEARVQSEWTEAFPDEKVSLQCVIPVSENWIYKWFKGSENVVSSDEGSIKDNTLTLSVKSGHEGDYACQAELKGRTVTTAKSKIHSLKVYGSKPTVVLKQDPPYPEIYTGEQVKLICSIKEETSKWQYQWQKHSVLVNNNTYTILNAAHDQNGEYNCTITRKEMTYTESTKLNISEPPRPKLSIESEWKTFYPTEKVTLKCSVDGGPNEWSYEWFKNSARLSVDSDISFSGDTLSISSAKAIHSGPYTCRGKHLTRTPVTTGQAEALQLDIYDIIRKPDITKHQWFEPFFTGEKVQLGCNMPGNGWNHEWSYEWFQNRARLLVDEDISFSGNTLSISSAKVSHSGQYTCEAKRGDFLVDSETLQVRVQDLPEARVQSEWTEAFPDEKVSLQCVIPVHENWIYKWFKGSGNVVSSDEGSIKDNTLTLSVKSGHEGKYACQAELKGRTVTTAKSETYSLTVHGSKPTVILKQDPPYPEIYTGEQVKLICSIKEKTSKWQYQWQKHSVLVNSSTYTILNAILDQKGEYTCSIKRREMTYAKSTKLNIREPPQPKLSIESEWKTFYPTEKVTLKCSIDGGPNEWSYEWFRKGSQLSDDKDISFSGDTLSISSAKAIHSGQYTCRGKHLTRTPVTTRQAESLQLNIYVNTTKPHIRKDQWFEFFYTEEEVHLDCNMPGDGWEFHWYKKSKPFIAKPNHTIKSASLSDTGVYHCKAKRGDFSVDSETLQVQVEARPPAVLSLETELSDIMSGNILTLRCNVSDGKQWSYAWFENGQKLNGSSHMFKVTATEETIKNEFKCKGIRTERPLYSALSEGFTANNIILKRKILLAISGCLVCCIIILIIGCLVLRFTRKPGKKETVQEDLFFSMADSKNQTASPLEEYMDNSPIEMEECEEKEELLTDHVSAVDEDDVIKDEDSPVAEANGLTSFKGL